MFLLVVNIEGATDPGCCAELVGMAREDVLLQTAED